MQVKKNMLIRSLKAQTQKVKQEHVFAHSAHSDHIQIDSAAMILTLGSKPKLPFPFWKRFYQFLCTRPERSSTLSFFFIQLLSLRYHVNACPSSSFWNWSWLFFVMTQISPSYVAKKDPSPVSNPFISYKSQSCAWDDVSYQTATIHTPFCVSYFRCPLLKPTLGLRLCSFWGCTHQKNSSASQLKIDIMS